MQQYGAGQGASTMPRRGRLRLLLSAIVLFVVIATLAALVVWVAPLAKGGAGAEDADLRSGAGSAVIHDDAGNVNHYASPLPHGKAATSNVGSAIIHDDAGNVHR